MVAYRDEVPTWSRDLQGRPQPPEKRRRSVLRAATKVATRQGWRCWHKRNAEGRYDLFEDEKRYQDASPQTLGLKACMWRNPAPIRARSNVRALPR